MEYFDFAGHGDDVDSDNSNPLFGRNEDIEVESDSDLDGFVAGDGSVIYESDRDDDPLHSEDDSVRDNVDSPPHYQSSELGEENDDLNIPLTWGLGDSNDMNTDDDSDSESDIIQRSSSAIIQISDSSDSENSPSSGSSRASQRRR
jgi:hypothetical protein